MCNRGEEAHCGLMPVDGWSDAVPGYQLEVGKRRLEFAPGLMSPTPTGPPHVLQWTPKFARKLAESSSGGEVFAPNEMADRMSALGIFEPS